MATPNLQTVLTVVSGSTDEQRKAFVWGKRVEPIAVGSRGQWIIRGPGVLAAHLYVSFDGRMVHVTAAGDGAKVLLRNEEVDQNWRAVPVPSELRFGSAVISVVCEEVPGEPAVEQGLSAAPAPIQTLIVSPDEMARHDAALAAVEAARAVAPPAAEKRPSAPPAAVVPVAPVRVDGRRSDPPPAGPAMAPVRAMPTVLGGSGIPVQATPPAPVPASPAPVHVAAPVKVAPPPAQVAPAPAPVPTAPPHARPAPEPEAAPQAPEERPGFQVAWQTMADGGLLRDHARKLAGLAPEATEGAQEQYAAEVKVRAGSANVVPAAPELAAPAPGHAYEPPAKAWGPPPGARGSDPPGGVAHASLPDAKGAPPPTAPETSEKKSLLASAAKSWKETSTVKKIVLALLPFAGFAALWEPPAPEEPPPQVVAQPEPSSGAPGTKPAERAAAAKNETVQNEAAKAGASVEVPPAGSQAEPVASAVAAKEEPAPSAAASGTVDAHGTPAAPAATARPGAAAAIAVPAASASPDELAAQQANAVLEQRAVSAALEGRLEEAASLYSRIAKSRPEARVYAIAAELARNGAVRKP